MLLNEFLKEHCKMEQQETRIGQLKSSVTKHKATATEQQKEIQTLTASLTEQAAQIQRVSAELEASKPALQVVNNKQ
jgi:septal ring factor EnvC (AmiA/AmiB activator)